METKERVKRTVDAYWRNRIYGICLLMAGITLVIEVIYWLMGVGRLFNIGDISVYAVRYLLVPVSINFGGIVITKWVLESKKFSVKQKNRMVCYLAFLLTAVIQCTHFSYAETTLLPCIVIMFAALFVDLKLCRNIWIVSHITLMIAVVERYVEGVYSNFRAITGLIIAVVALYGSYCMAKILAQHESAQFWLLSRSSKKKGELMEQIRIEPTTGLFTRRVLMDNLDQYCKEAVRKGAKPIQLAMLDVDNFKQINDKYGHVHGDEVLRVIGQIICEYLQGNGEGFRYGGEEFAIILKEDNLQAATKRMERIRIALAETKFDFLENENITLSCGIAEYSKGIKTCEWINKADALLYAAKNTGKNRTVVRLEKAG